MMADDADTAQAIMEAQIGDALAARPRMTGHSATHCIDCGNEIPEARRFALAGVKTCLECASARERRR